MTVLDANREIDYTLGFQSEAALEEYLEDLRRHGWDIRSAGSWFHADEMGSWIMLSVRAYR